MNKVDITRAPTGLHECECPAGDPTWHPVAARWYDSLSLSGQSVFYEPSDWAMAYLLAESISRELQPHQVVVKDEKGARVETVLEPPKGASLVAWLRGMASLLVSEGERRRVRVELESAEQVDPREEAAIAHIEQFRRKYASSDE